MTNPADYIHDVVKHVITLSSAGIVLVATLKEKFFVSGAAPWEIVAYFVTSVLTIAVALLGISTLAGRLERNASVKIYEVKRPPK